MSMSSGLAASNSVSDWDEALAAYDDCIRKHSASAKRRQKLEDLDDHVRNKVPALIKERYSDATTDVGYLKKDELCKIVEWKITRGKFRCFDFRALSRRVNVSRHARADKADRPLMRYATALTPKEVETTTRQAFAQASVGDMGKAMETLISLKGIGPATASAILSFGDTKGNCPFLSDEAMHAFGLTNSKGKLDYTLANWRVLEAACVEKTKILNKASEGETETWTPALIERAVWAASASDSH